MTWKIELKLGGLYSPPSPLTLISLTVSVLFHLVSVLGNKLWTTLCAKRVRLTLTFNLRARPIKWTLNLKHVRMRIWLNVAGLTISKDVMCRTADPHLWPHAMSLRALLLLAVTFDLCGKLSLVTLQDWFRRWFVLLARLYLCYTWVMIKEKRTAMAGISKCTKYCDV